MPAIKYVSNTSKWGQRIALASATALFLARGGAIKKCPPRTAYGAFNSGAVNPHRVTRTNGQYGQLGAFKHTA